MPVLDSLCKGIEVLWSIEFNLHRENLRLLSTSLKTWVQFSIFYSLTYYDIISLRAIRPAMERKRTLESLKTDLHKAICILVLFYLDSPWVVQIPLPTHQKWNEGKKETLQSVPIRTKATYWINGLGIPLLQPHLKRQKKYSFFTHFIQLIPPFFILPISFHRDIILACWKSR